MPRIHSLNRTTNDKLLSALDDAAREGTITHIQWVGGRDWVVIYHKDVPEREAAR